MTTPPRPALDPELAAALTLLGDEITPSITPDMIPSLRQRRAHLLPTDTTLHPAYTETPHHAPSHDHTPIPLIHWHPTHTTAPTGALYWIHGGGMIMGSHRGTEIPGLLETAHELDLALISVDYRLAPEHPHPTPVEDCYAGLTWITDNATDLGLDPTRIVIGGGSAGGGLAAATTLLARDRGGPALQGQLLICPMLDDRNDTVSSHQMAGTGVWDRTSNATGWTALLGTHAGGPDVSPHAAPARAQDLSGLPPAFLDVGSAETFRDEVVDYASRIWQAGGSAELHVWPGGFHGFDGIAPQAALSRSARAQRLPWLRRITGA
ncbi:MULTISPECIES: alpha/beta hydrolase [Nocardiopsis]|uniref:Alpha/beta hydrolase fold-3 domain protein n=1 Tax=Nocardiopsis dassonvillei (strain ATCC 23218 / DSM 43111 / CIP 107115 / JCM 7437 / KCTC 9190 / NBRC 14626 / NCTC 10488 / NRRL B-5397 / IMRU 509) TaxID=446468 RepID=D7AUR2_NOCDD|nr:alpha/beta hydrolase [Nocardiopsis dassonvillei]ADH67642.1 Alpha/beta hydrolase fold-3 domain protein [Nocardiopsis dassonvillei subsp. dassonvillei DSM 43111]NKY82398.1 alpha/beta hydrolase [Nocardiopsis dassonvillei]VEI88030.1 Lipase 2 [Nocardiopsis dassonvillei]